MFKQRTKLAHRVAGTSPAVKASPQADGNRGTPPPPQFYNPNAVGGYQPSHSPGLNQAPQTQQQIWQQSQATPPAPQQYPPTPQQQWYSPTPQQQQQQQPTTKPPPPLQNNNNSMNDAWNWGTQQWETNNDTQYQQQNYHQQQQQQPPPPQPQLYNNQQTYQQPQQNQDSWNWGWNQSQDSAWNWGSEDSSPSTDQSTEQQNQPPQQNQYQQNKPQNQYPQQQYQPQQQQQQQPNLSQEPQSTQQFYQQTQPTVENQYNKYQQQDLKSLNESQQYQHYTQESIPPSPQQHQQENSSESMNQYRQQNQYESTEYQHYNNYQPDLSSYEINKVSQQLSDVNLHEEKINQSMVDSVTENHHQTSIEGNISMYSNENQHQSTEQLESTIQGRESTLSTYSNENQRNSLVSLDSILQDNQPNDSYSNQLVDQVVSPAMENLQLNAENQPINDFENKEIVTPEGYTRVTYGAEFENTEVKSVNLESVPDNIERLEDTPVPVQPETPPPPPPPVSQGHRVGVGQDDPCPWPSTIPPPENQETTPTPPPPSKPPLRPPLSLRHRATHSNSPPLPPPPAISPAPTSLDPVSASDRNQFLETGQLSADMSIYGRRQTIPGESRRSPEPERVIPGTTEPDLPESTRSETIGSDFGDEIRTNAEGINMDPENRLRTNAEGNSPLQQPTRIPDNTETRPIAEGIRTHAEGTNNPVVPPPRQDISRVSANTIMPPRGDMNRMSAEGTNNPVIQTPIPRDTRTHGEGTNVIQPPNTTRTSAEGTNEDRRSRNALTSTPRTSSAFTEVRSSPRNSVEAQRPPRSTTEPPRNVKSTTEGQRNTRSSAEGVQSNVTSLRSSGEGDPSLASDEDEGEISDLENVSSGEPEKEEGELDESLEERKEERKKSPLQARAMSAESEHRPPSTGRRDRPRRDRRESEERRSEERARAKPPRPADDKDRRRDRESQPRTRRHRYDADDSDSYHSDRYDRHRDKYRDRNKSPDSRHKSSRHRGDDYYRDDYRHRDYRYGSRPSSRAGSERREYYESDQQERGSERGRYHRDPRDPRDPRAPGPRDKPPSGSDRYRRDPRDPRDPYYRGGYDSRSYGYPQPQPQPRPPPVTAMQHPEYNSFTYAYFVELRHSNPKAYDEWYRSYIASASSQHGGGGSGTYDGFVEDEHNSRGSVHSGRSSINDEISAVNAMGDVSTTAVVQQRLTPAKFSCAPTIAQLTIQGTLVHILPHYPRDRQVATVVLHDITALFSHDPAQVELRSFPGPLVKGTTHKNSVIQFCTQKIRNAQQDCEMIDRDSYILLWRLLILLLRQNGTVVGADIAELLLEDQVDNSTSLDTRSLSPRSHDDGEGEPRSLNLPRMSEEQATYKFRQYLLSGNTKEALDWAMKNGLWGHALFLASKLDQRTYNNVLIRFANGLTMNDPLQTLYQLMSGRLPAAVTSCADEKWGDWKPHLAMILSNPSQRPELDHKAITTLGDTLAGRGCLYASHFCYLLAQLEFGCYEQQPPAKLVLLGSPHTALPFECFSSSEAIQCTEVYEYARRLADPTFCLSSFQPYKFLYAARLVEYGLVSEALAYCEEIAGTMIQHCGSGLNPGLVEQLVNLADSLKQMDPLFNQTESSLQEDGAQFYASDPAWLTQLRQLNLQQPQQQTMDDSMFDTTYTEGGGVIEYGSAYYSQQDQSDAATQENYEEQWRVYYEQQKQWEQQQQQQQGGDNANVNTAEVAESSSEQPQQQEQQQQQQPNSGYWQPPVQQQWTPPDTGASEGVGEITSPTLGTSPEPVTLTPQPVQQNYNYWDMQTQQNNSNSEPEPPTPAPTITLPNARRQKTLSESSSGGAASNHKPTSPKQTNKKPPQQPGQASGGWLGGLWSKISLKPKNQMILPDDKNPTIVWDPDRKRWVNTDAEEDEATSELKPPPRAPMMSMPVPTNQNTVPGGNMQSQQAPTSLPPAAGSGYKLSRAGMRKNYVNVLQPNGTSGGSKPAAAPADIFPSISQPTSAPVNFFVPAPVSEGEVAGTEFTTPASSAPQSPQQTTDSEPSNQVGGVPMMYNPAQFTANQYQR